MHKEQVLRDGTFFLRDGEKVATSRLFSVLRRWIILDKAQSSVRKLFALFDKHVLQTFKKLLRTVLTDNELYDRESHTTLTFLISGYVARGYVPSLDY